MMKQLTLFQAWGTANTLPIELVKILHEFLPSTDELFCEQRFRFLQEGILSDKDYDHELDNHPNVKLVAGIFHLDIPLDIHATMKTGKRVFKNYMNVYLGVEYKMCKVNVCTRERLRCYINYLTNDDNVPEVEFTTANIIDIVKDECKAVVDTAKYINEEFFEKHPSADPSDAPHDIATMERTERSVFVLKPEYHRWTTMRHDKELCFHPTLSAQALALLL